MIIIITIIYFHSLTTFTSAVTTTATTIIESPSLLLPLPPMSCYNHYVSSPLSISLPQHPCTFIITTINNSHVFPLLLSLTLLFTIITNMHHHCYFSKLLSKIIIIFTTNITHIAYFHLYQHHSLHFYAIPPLL